MAGRLLVVDNDRALLSSLRRLLTARGYHVHSLSCAEEALAYLLRERVDLLILDVCLPGRDGLSFCQQVRSRWHFPIIIVTGRDGTADKVIGLEAGADDYVTKPFDPPELLARIRAQLRRATEYSEPSPEPGAISIGDLRIDTDQRQAFVAGRLVSLTDREFELMLLFARNRLRALARNYLFEAVWGYDAELSPKTLAVYVRRLRMKIERDPENPEYIHTVRGFGYKLAPPQRVSQGHL
jgi:DNA-binding response OmpR family regulator